MSKQEGGPQKNLEEKELPREMKLGSGEIVIDRPDSHLHEGLGELLDEALAKVNSEGKDFIESETDFGREVGKTSLTETNAKDIIVFAQRPRRAGLTRFVKGREADTCSSVTVVLKKGDRGQYPGNYYVLLTAYVGHITPPEPWSERDFIKRPDPDAARKKSRGFWSNHALVYGSEPILSNTETDVCPW